MTANNAAARRTTSLTGSSRLSLSVGKNNSPAPNGSGRHPLKHEQVLTLTLVEVELTEAGGLYPMFIVRLAPRWNMKRKFDV